MSTRSLRLVVVAVAAGLAVVVSSLGASATPPFYPSNLDSTPDPLSAYVPQSGCVSGGRPGALALRDLLLAYYPGTRSLGIVRACDAGGTSEHKEGRAFDWGVRVDVPAEKAAADEFTGWLLADDPWGNPSGGARRMGLMYMIWDGRIWGSYKAEDGWRTYTGANPHTDHVHFSMSWDGAYCDTSWWRATGCVGALPPPPAPAGEWTSVLGIRANSTGRDHLAFHRSSDGRLIVHDTLRQGLLTAQLSSTGLSPGWTIVGSADLDGNGRDAWFMYRAGDGQLAVYRSSADGGLGARLSSYSISRRWTQVLAADLDGNGDDELIFYRASTGAYAVYEGLPDGSLGTRLSRYSLSSGWTQITAADLDGDGVDELLFYRASTGRFAVYPARPDGALGAPLKVYDISRGWTQVSAPDLDGDGDDELVFYRAPTETFLVYTGRADGRLGPRLYP